LAQAQSFSVGAFGGWNRSTISFSEEPFDVSPRNGFNVGAMAAVNFTPNWAVELAGMYTAKGAKVEDPAFDDGAVEVDYIEVPLLLRATIPTQGDSRLSFHLYAGPAIGFQLSCNIWVEGSGQRVEDKCDSETFEAKTKSTDFSLFFGGGVGIGAGPGDIQLDIAYDLGLSNLIDEAGDPTEAKNRTLMLTAGYLLPVGGS
jgi:hypothetical protein